LHWMKKIRNKKILVMSNKKYWKIYTKGGDKGQTSLIGGKRVPKYHDRIEAYGTIDELISYIGLLRDQNIEENSKNILITIQKKLMICASLLATTIEDSNDKLPELKESDIEYLEKEIDIIENSLPELKSFILPGGHISVSICHIARNICRRAERRVVYLTQNYEIDSNIIKYLNRLSDFLFVFSRKLSKDFNIKEILW